MGWERYALVRTGSDAAGDILTETALRSMAEAINTSVLFLTYEHDPLHPPIGRFANAEVVMEPDGSASLHADVFRYAPRNYRSLVEAGLRPPDQMRVTEPIASKELDLISLRILHDATTADLAADLAQECKPLLRTSRHEYLRKSTIADAMLVAAIAVPTLELAKKFFGAIAGKLTETLAEDAYARLKVGASRLLLRSAGPTRWFIVRLTVPGLRVNACMSNVEPSLRTDEAMDRLLKLLAGVDTLVLPARRHSLREASFLWRNGWVANYLAFAEPIALAEEDRIATDQTFRLPEGPLPGVSLEGASR